MTRRLLDSNKLISYWHHKRAARALEEFTEQDARNWAQELAREYENSFVVWPVILEVLAGTVNSHELNLTRAYLGVFTIPTNGEVQAEDWREARRIAERVPRDGTRRQMADCLIRAIAKRLKMDVATSDRRFPR